jgi:hypothetical protein
MIGQQYKIESRFVVINLFEGSFLFLQSIPGCIEVGTFLGNASEAYIGYHNGTVMKCDKHGGKIKLT